MVRSLARIFLVVTILLVAVPSTQAAESRMEDRSGWMSWSFLADLWETLSSVWGENGCWVDPNGGCLDSARGENGCMLDPDGRCHESARGDNGCILDPSGRCLDSAWGENGCILDPNGGCRD